MGGVLLLLAVALVFPAAAVRLVSVVESPEACPAGPGPEPRTTCRPVIVSCSGLKDLRAQIRVTEPGAGKPLRGTVVLGSGGNGGGFYAGQEAVQSLVRELAEMGLLVVDRTWDGGWVTQEGGLKK